MKQNNIEILHQLCIEMGIEWDDTADSLKVNGEPIGDNFDFSSIFQDNDYFV